MEWVVVADWAEDCLETWTLNHGRSHPSCQILRLDLATAEGKEAVITAAQGGIDLVVGGIPCEEVSVARANRPAPPGVLERWLRLLHNCLDIVKTLAPCWWAFEDVIGIEKHLPPPLWHGLDIPVQRIQASHFGPQRRLRTFVGHFPNRLVPAPGARVLREVLRPGPYRTIPRASTYRRARGYYSGGTIWVWEPEQPGFTVLDWGGRHTRGAMVETHGGQVRQLEWQEAATLQGFPDDYIFVGSYGRTWKMVAQAIPVYVGRAILQAIVHERDGSLPGSAETTSQNTVP